MTTYADIHEFADRMGERRRQVEAATPSVLRALGRAVVGPADVGPGAAAGPVRATAELLATTLDELDRAEEELRVQNEALFAAHTELEEEQQVFLDLFELAPVAYFVTTANGRLLRLNGAAFALLGRPINLAVGKPLAVYVAPEDRAAFRGALPRPKPGGPVESWRMRLVPRDGEPVECRVHTRAVWPAPAGGPEAAREPVLYWVITPELCEIADDLA